MGCHPAAVMMWEGVNHTNHRLVVRPGASHHVLCLRQGKRPLVVVAVPLPMGFHQPLHQHPLLLNTVVGDIVVEYMVLLLDLTALYRLSSRKTRIHSQVLGPVDR